MHASHAAPHTAVIATGRFCHVGPRQLGFELMYCYVVGYKSGAVLLCVSVYNTQYKSHPPRLFQSIYTFPF
jgi:hypothetical protein